MIGAAACLLGGAMLTSCSSDKDLYDGAKEAERNAENLLKDYAANFQKVFGEISPDQTWGFGAPAGARATRAVFANGNEWAANDREDLGYKVPPVLTEEQKRVVIKYFQTVKNPAYEDPQWTDYFIQQVYKGNPNTALKSNSPEQYKAADGNTDIVGSDHMDHLAAIDSDANPEFVDHNNNFNHGDCGVYGNVLDYKGTLATVEETYPVNDATHRHADKINLMLNSTTKSFGYYNSNSSVRRTEYTGLVSYQTIINTLGAEANCLNDGWNRSFMGFDFEMLADKEMYSTTKYDANGNIVYWGDYDHEVVNYFSISLNGQDQVWDGKQMVDATTVGKVETDQWGNKQLYPYMPGTTELVPLLSENKNQYAGTPDPAWSDTDWEHYVNGTKYTSVEKMLTALADSKLPTNNKSWVKIGGTADGYYSDWIVTLTKAEKFSNTPTPPTKPFLRVIAEDLTTKEKGDFDFNDIVFDVEYVSGTQAKVTILAAGGTLPLTINGQEVHQLFIDANPNASTDQGGEINVMTMINTNAQRIARAPYSSAELENKPVLNLSGNWSDDQDTFSAQVRDNIPLVVTKTNEDGTTYPLTLTAEKGKTPGKVGIASPYYEWKQEKVYIGDNFKKFVSDPTYAMWWKE